jgi:hypothetical protein
MPIQFSLGTGLLRAAVLLGFLGCLVAQPTLHSQTATSEPLIVTGKALIGASGATPSFCASRSANLNNTSVPAPSAVFAGSDSMLTNQVEIVSSDDDIALEDSIEMLRVDVQQRTFGLHQVEIGPKIASKAALNTRPNISPPLLV